VGNEGRNAGGDGELAGDDASYLRFVASNWQVTVAAKWTDPAETTARPTVQGH